MPGEIQPRRVGFPESEAQLFLLQTPLLSKKESELRGCMQPTKGMSSKCMVETRRLNLPQLLCP